MKSYFFFFFIIFYTFITLFIQSINSFYTLKHASDDNFKINNENKIQQNQLYNIAVSFKYNYVN